MGVNSGREGEGKVVWLAHPGMPWKDAPCLRHGAKKCHSKEDNDAGQGPEHAAGPENAHAMRTGAMKVTENWAPRSFPTVT